MASSGENERNSPNIMTSNIGSESAASGGQVEIGLRLQGDEDLARLGLPQWVVVEHAIGHDPWDRNGVAFDAYAEVGVQVICRLVHGFTPKGTLPFSQNYGAFARRCANFVAASSGCHVWIIGNEPNDAAQWPAIVHPTDDGTGGSPSSAQEIESFQPDGSPASDVGSVEPGARQLAETEGSPVENATAETRLPWWKRLLGAMGSGARSEHSRATVQAGVPTGALTVGVPRPRFAIRGGLRLPVRFNGAPSGPPLMSPDAGISDTSAEDETEGIAQDYAEVITPRKYVACYRLCRRAIRALPGHENDLVLPAALAPWTTHAGYAANPTGDWAIYFRHMMGMLSAQECDGIALHVVTDPGAAADDQAAGNADLDASLALLKELHADLAELPVFIDECAPLQGWEAASEKWLTQTLAAIEKWWGTRANPLRAVVVANETRGPWRLSAEAAETIALLPLLRPWEPSLAWGNAVKPVVHAPVMTPIGPNRQVVTTTVVNLRRSAGYLDKDAEDIVAELAGGVRLTVVGQESVQRDGLVWWQVRVEQGDARGWIAERGPDGRELIVVVTGTTPGSIRRGVKIRALMPARIRRTPGYVGKPDNDVLGEAGSDSVWGVTGGPVAAQDLTWWEVEGDSPFGALKGWVAETAPGGLQLFAVVDEQGGGGGSPPTVAPGGRFKPGDRVMTLAYVRLRRSPGYVNKPAEDILTDVWLGTEVVILNGPRALDDLIWYEVEARVADGPILRGWMAEESPDGVILLGVREQRFEEYFAVGELIVVSGSSLRIRNTAGVENKPETDVLGEFYPRTTLNTLGGPQQADQMRWWQVAGIATHGAVRGWVAQSTVQGVALIRRPPVLPGTDIPNRQSGHYLHRPFEGRWGISQLWGQNPQMYARFTYDGVPLLGHNGIDFLTPMRTPILASESGVVAAAAFEPGGFGHYVLLQHSWGQSIYAHLDSIAVGTGQAVHRGQRLGVSGDSGNSTGPHLHYAIRINPYQRTDGWGGFSDPLPYMAPGDVILPARVQDQAIHDIWPEPLLDLVNAPALPPPGMIEETPGMVRP